jgi:hypothetical protein
MLRPLNLNSMRPRSIGWWARKSGSCVYAVAVLLFVYAHGARAQENSIERELTAAPGRDVRVGVFTSIRPDCTSGPLPAIKLAGAPAHGTVTVKRAVLRATNVKQCLAIEVPALVAFYRAAQNFSGTDVFDLEISFVGGRKQIQHFRLNVANDSGGGHGI